MCLLVPRMAAMWLFVAVACLALDLALAVCCRCLAVTAWHRLAVPWWCPVVWAARHRRLARWLCSRLAAHLRAVVMCRCPVARVVLVWVVTSPSRLALGHRRAAQCASRRVVVMPVVWCRCHLARRRVRHLG